MFDKSTWIQLPRNVLVGHGVLDDVSEAVADAGVTGTPLIVTSPTPKEVAGDRVADQYPDATVATITEASFDAVERIRTTADDGAVDFLIGVGGGKAIDVAKLAADDLDMGLISVPTAASHDGIVSGRGSIPDGDTRHSVASSPPLAVVADTGVLADAPWELTTAGCADILSNHTAVRDWQLAHRTQSVPYSEYAGTLAQMTAEMLIENAGSIRPGHESAAWSVTKALVSSGVAMSIAGSSRPASGAEHLVSHRLDRLADSPALHGHQVGVAMLLTAYLQDGGDGLWTRLQQALAQIGAPTTISELGIDEETFIEAVTTCHTIRDRYTILGSGIPRSAAVEAARETEIIGESE